VEDYERVPLLFYGEFDIFCMKLMDYKYVRILYKFYRVEFFSSDGTDFISLEYFLLDS